MSYYKDFYEEPLPSALNSHEPISPEEDLANPLFIDGYPVADLEFAAKLMNSAGLTPDDLRKCIDNIEYVVALVYSDLHNAMNKTAAEFAARMLNQPWKGNV